MCRVLRCLGYTLGLFPSVCSHEKHLAVYPSCLMTDSMFYFSCNRFVVRLPLPCADNSPLSPPRFFRGCVSSIAYYPFLWRKCTGHQIDSDIAALAYSFAFIVADSEGLEPPTSRQPQCRVLYQDELTIHLPSFVMPRPHPRSVPECQKLLTLKTKIGCTHGRHRTSNYPQTNLTNNSCRQIGSVRVACRLDSLFLQTKQHLNKVRGHGSGTTMESVTMKRGGSRDHDVTSSSQIGRSCLDSVSPSQAHA